MAPNLDNYHCFLHVIRAHSSIVYTREGMKQLMQNHFEKIGRPIANVIEQAVLCESDLPGIYRPPTQKEFIIGVRNVTNPEIKFQDFLLSMLILLCNDEEINTEYTKHKNREDLFTSSPILYECYHTIKNEVDQILLQKNSESDF